MYHKGLSFGKILVMVAVVATGIIFSACEEGVNPILESDRYFSLYGYLDMDRDTQFVRVDEIRPTLQLTDATPLDVQFFSTDLTTGDVITWRDSVFAYDDGTFAHIYYAPFRIIATHTYRVDVVRSDGATTWAVTTVPAKPSPLIRDPVIRFVGTATLLYQTVLWQGVTRETDSTAVWYRMFSSSGTPMINIVLPPNRTQLMPDGWEVRIDLTSDRDSLQRQVGRRILLGMGMDITLRDPEWDPPGGTYDPRALSQPGVFSNVENGFGFVGSVGKFSVEWVIDPETAALLGHPLPGKNEE